MSAQIGDPLVQNIYMEISTIQENFTLEISGKGYESVKLVFFWSDVGKREGGSEYKQNAAAALLLENLGQGRTAVTRPPHLTPYLSQAIRHFFFGKC